jgi:hypothetical protein
MSTFVVNINHSHKVMMVSKQLVRVTTNQNNYSQSFIDYLEDEMLLKKTILLFSFKMMVT